MNDALVLASAEDGILWLTLNQPARRNPLSSDMIAALSASIASGNEDANTRVVVIKAAGPAFSAGICGKRGAATTRIRALGRRESMRFCRIAPQ